MGIHDSVDIQGLSDIGELKLVIRIKRQRGLDGSRRLQRRSCLIFD